MSTHSRRRRPLAKDTPAPKLRVRASYGGCPDITIWDLLYDDVYQCLCCGTRQHLSELTVQP